MVVLVVTGVGSRPGPACRPIQPRTQPRASGSRGRASENAVLEMMHARAIKQTLAAPGRVIQDLAFVWTDAGAIFGPIDFRWVAFVETWAARRRCQFEDGSGFVIIVRSVFFIFWLLSSRSRILGSQCDLVLLICFSKLMPELAKQSAFERFSIVFREFPL